MQRALGRQCNQMRPVTASYNLFSQADSSVIFALGKTQVLCAITLQPGVPKFLKNKGSGWLTAEYNLLPTATHERIARESATGHRDGRTIEISRVIGRTLRSCVDLTTLGESTIIVDCDVLCADGGTRVASINAAALALQQAENYWLSKGSIKNRFLIQKPAAVAIGVTTMGTILVDPDYREDIEIIADFNIIATQQGIIEVQGGAEKKPIDWELFNTICTTAQKVIEPLFDKYDAELANGACVEKGPLFSLKNRLMRSTQEKG